MKLMISIVICLLMTWSSVQGASDKLTIHLIAHTHNDIGWLKTIDQYYYNSNRTISHEGVQYILDATFPVLDTQPDKQFIYVEMGFFQRWWRQQNNATRARVSRLLQNGQFEFINGGYCMNDEAAVYYEDSIDQMTLGHQFLLQTFNVIPTIGWHIDPFGHASAQAALFAQMGFKAFFFSRIDYQDRNVRVADEGMEMLWIPQTSQGIENAMFTHVNYFGYAAPSGFCFDILCTDDPIMDDPRLEGYNLEQKAQGFAKWFTDMKAGYQASTLMHTIGEDFQFNAPRMNFKNNDKLLAFFANNPNYNLSVQYSTPTKYIDTIYDLNLTYPNKTDDFFPYADRDSGFWTGYFTSRVALKGLVREQGRLLQAVKRLATQIAWQNTSDYINNNFTLVNASIYKLEEALAIGQHHDAVTGTSKQAVAEDYKRYFGVGESAAKQSFLYPYFQERVQTDLNLTGLQFDTCHLNTSAAFCNVTYNNLTEATPVLLVIYNSGAARISTIRVKVPNGNVSVRHYSGANITADVICANSTDATDCDLFFADSFLGYSVNYYYLNYSETSIQIAPQNITLDSNYSINANQTISAQNLSSFTIAYCNDSTKTSCYQTTFNLAYNYYKGYQDNDGQTSGAYIFRPSNSTINASLSYDVPVSALVYQGQNLLQIQAVGNKTIFVLRIYNDLTNGIELQTFIDSIPVDDKQGKEIVLIVDAPSIKSQNISYTDSMGMELQKRVPNYRATWALNITQPVAGNYYPVQSTILINDTSSGESLAILPDRAQGGTSLQDGQIELMIHRRLLVDDRRGVNQPLNETDWDGQGLRQWVTHTLLFTKPGFITTSYRQIQINNDVANIVLLSPTTQTTFTELSQDIPRADNFGNFDPYVKLLSRPLTLRKYLFRFHNMDDINTRNVSTNVFTNAIYGTGTIIETSLTANQAKTDMLKKRLNWNGLQLNNPTFANNDYLTLDYFSLRPQEIRTFTVEFPVTVNQEIINV